VDEQGIPAPGPAQVREALAGGPLAGLAARDAARELTAAFPGAPGLPAAAWGAHARMAEQAVLGPGPAEAVIFTAAGIAPRESPLHDLMARAAPGTPAVYLSRDPEAAELNLALLGQPGRVHAGTADDADPGAVLEAAARAGADPGRRLSVHVLASPQRWEPDLAVTVLAGYRRLLAPGSTVCLTLGDTEPGRDGDRWLEAVSAFTGRTYRHARGDVAGWAERAGLRLVTVSRAVAWGREPWAAARLEAARHLVRVTAAVLVRR